MTARLPRSALLVVPVLATACGQLIGVDDVSFGAPVVAVCDATQRSCEPNFVVETQNMFVYGRWEPYRAERIARAKAQIEASEADVLCLTEFGAPNDRQQLRDGVAGAYPFSHFVHTDESSPVDVPETIDGNPPAPPGDPLCAGLDAQVDAGLDCLAAHCSTVPGSDLGLFTSDECATEFCQDTVLALKSREERLCAQCIHAVMDDHSIADARRACSVPPGGMRLGYSGENATMLLSKHPLSRLASFVLPSTRSRQVVLRATVDKPGLAPVDVYCTRFTSNNDGAFDYYEGPYGGDSTGLAAWDNESQLQAMRAAQWVLAARPYRAIFMGWLAASREVMIDGELWAQGYRPKTLEVFDAAFIDAVPATFPGCTACLANPLFDDTYVDRRTDHVFLLGLDKSNVVDVAITNTEPVVPVEPGPRSKGKAIVPISDHYGLRVGLRVPG